MTGDSRLQSGGGGKASGIAGIAQLALGAVLCAGAWGCSSSNHSGAAAMDSGAASSDAAMAASEDASFNGSNPGGPVHNDGGAVVVLPLLLAPAMKVLTLTSLTGKPPTQQFSVTQGGKPVTHVKWLVDRPDIATISSTGLLTITGQIAGVVQVTAQTATSAGTVQLTVKIAAEQNGDDKTGAAAGAGGLGGVGGEGQGVAVSAAMKKLLLGKPTSDPDLKWLYPYDRTVWPRGMLAPLLQWSATSHAAEAIYLHLQSKSGLVDYKGYFGRPSMLAAADALVHHPLPQAAWSRATDSAGDADTLTLSMVVVSGGVAYGPIKQTWTVAPARLRGIIYYESYGTQLVKNETGAQAGDGRFGGAVLAIKPQSTDPALIAGTTTDNRSGCRVCHVVSPDGSKLIAQQGDDGFVYATSFMYDLKNKNAETQLTTPLVFSWSALYPDGSLALSNGEHIGSDGTDVGLYALPSEKAVTTTGLSGFVQRAATPIFSPDGKHVAFNFMSGTGMPPSIPAGDEKQLVVMDFNKKTSEFSNPRVVYTAMGSDRPMFPSFLPSNDAVLFQRHVSGNLPTGGLNSNGRAELMWADAVGGKAAALDELNGKHNGVSYLPTGPSGHDDDTTLNYEASAGPIPAGGYAWVVFASRRLYGNVGTVDPFASDPRNLDLTKNVTTKKLWCAAVDLHAMPGTDPSHPGFYLPAQELFAGNSRGFWSPEPCRAGGQTCETGDQCCTGFCRAPTPDVQPECTTAPPTCSQESERCIDKSDCCSATADCINNYCAVPGPT